MPNITANNTEGKVDQIHSYLFQLSEQLLYAFNEVEREEKALVRKIETKSLASGTNDVAEAQNTFNAIKSLIIKSADIINAYYEEMNSRFDQVYVAESDFGIYAEQTAQQITANAEGIEQIIESVKAIISSVENIEDTILKSESYIKTGILGTDEDGFDITGLEIGQKNIKNGEEVFNKFARFTADRLSFYDQNDVEVAYISDYRLYITEAQISGNIVIGKYVIDSSNGLLFKWAGE